jgi:hypothetical protein
MVLWVNKTIRTKRLHDTSEEWPQPAWRNQTQAGRNHEAHEQKRKTNHTNRIE